MGCGSSLRPTISSRCSRRQGYVSPPYDCWSCGRSMMVSKGLSRCRMSWHCWGLPIRPRCSVRSRFLPKRGCSTPLTMAPGCRSTACAIVPTGAGTAATSISPARCAIRPPASLRYPSLPYPFPTGSWWRRQNMSSRASARYAGRKRRADCTPSACRCQAGCAECQQIVLHA